MSRIRTIKPDFWEDEKVGQLPIPCRLFFIGCWNFADDFGVIKGNAALLKSQIFPYDENLRVSEIKKWIDALVNARMLIPIIHAEESYYIIRTFRSHQVLDNRYSKSYISKDKSLVSKIVDDALNNNSVNTSSSQCVHNVITVEEMEMEEKEKEDNSIELSKKAQEDSSERMDWIAFEETFNKMMPPSIPRIKGVKEDRRKKVKERIKEYGKEALMVVFNKVVESDFLSGRKTDWRCNFDWIFNKTNFRKIYEGNYDNGASNHKTYGQLRINSGAVQDQEVNIYREVFGYDGDPSHFEEWLNSKPYGS